MADHTLALVEITKRKDVPGVIRDIITADIPISSKLVQLEEKRIQAELGAEWSFDDPLSVSALQFKATLKSVIPDVVGHAADGYTAKLFPEEDKKKFAERMSRTGFMTLYETRDFITKELGAFHEKLDGVELSIDGDLLIQIDNLIDDKLFLIKEEVYSRDTLYLKFPQMQDFGIVPETVFSQLLIAVFSASDGDLRFKVVESAAYHKDAEVQDTIEDTEKQLMFLPEELHMDHSERRRPSTIVRTKIYKASDAWDDFVMMSSLTKSFNTVVRAQQTTSQLLLGAPDHVRLAIAADPARAPPLLSALTAGATALAALPAAPAQQQLMLTDGRIQELEARLAKLEATLG